MLFRSEIIPGPRRTEVACCGSYPRRFPYRHEDFNRGCCVDKVYNAEIMQCCEDGRVDIAC